MDHTLISTVTWCVPLYCKSPGVLKQSLTLALTSWKAAHTDPHLTLAAYMYRLHRMHLYAAMCTQCQWPQAHA